MQNEELSNKTITFTTKNVAKALKYLAKYGFKGLKALAKSGKHKIYKPTEGKQSYKNLVKSGQGLSGVDIFKSEDMKNLSPVDISRSKQVRLFKKAAKQYRMDFAVKKDKKTGLYHLFFKAKDKEVYDKVFSNYKDALEKLGEKKAEKAKAKTITEKIADKAKEVKDLSKGKAKPMENELTR